MEMQGGLTGGQSCTSPIEKGTYTSAGLKSKILLKLKALNSSFSLNSGLSSLPANDSDTVKAFTKILPQLSGILGYTAILEKNGYSVNSDGVLSSIADLLSVQLLSQALDQIESYTSTAIGINPGIMDMDEIYKYQEAVKRSKMEIARKMDEAVTKYQHAEQSFQKYLAIKHEIDQVMLSKFGKGGCNHYRYEIQPDLCGE